MRRKAQFILVLLCVCFFSLPVAAQQQADDVVRVNTELVQTDVMVFDRRGRFVDGLKPEQFVLTLNGEAKPISFFDRVGSASGRQTLRPAVNTPGPVSEERGKTTPGRVIFFFIDDVHLSSESLARARQTLFRFVENKLNDDDRVAIVQPAGRSDSCNSLLTINQSSVKQSHA